MKTLSSLLLAICLLVSITTCSLADPVSTCQQIFEFGFAKVDITPEQPLRLSGYGNRASSFDGIDEKLYARVMSMRVGDDGPLHVLVTVETIGFPAAVTQEIFARAKQSHGLTQNRFVLCCTHTHTAPHIRRGLSNLFTTPLNADDQQRIDEYTNRICELIGNAIDDAIVDLKPGRMLVAQGKATFARNRRVLEDGIWTGFGENPNGPVDHSLPVIRIMDPDAKKIRGLLFNYACHCTTFGGDYNRVNGDWAGYASQLLETTYTEAFAMCTIGCGADANPQRDSQRALELASLQGREIADEVSRLIDGDNWLEILPLSEDSVQANFDYAGLPIDRPSDKQLHEAVESPRLQVRRHAQFMLNTKQRMGRLPATYPMPIHVWRFGNASQNNQPANQFAMVFLGGEVCVDYALQIRDELSKTADNLAKENIWVSAYANDVFGYVASERMRSEGGYEVDFSMVYYLQPGRWSSGTEDIILASVDELFHARRQNGPLDVDQSLQTFSTTDDLHVEVIAAEPLVRDPINFSVDARGRLWVVEMGDYPRGDPASLNQAQQVTDLGSGGGSQPWDGAPGGRIKILTDTDRDGRFDQSTRFLDSLTFPTGVFPWRDGVIVCEAPDIYFARDSDGNGKCDQRDVLFTGFEEANPQHRVGGFEWGLDGWLYLSAGNHENGEITSIKTGQTINSSGRDLRIHPESGKIETVSGPSQWGRCRDDFGNWYGNDNTRPLFQFVIEEKFLKRNPYVASPTPRAYLTTPASSPEVFPTSRTVERYNDLNTSNRFTSACGPLILRGVNSNQNRTEALICEPVHNLISRLEIQQNDPQFSGSRRVDERQSEFLASTDNWFRPVRIMPAPNEDLLWLCDMYRHVIEHPEWIPEAWQASLDLYAGSDRGRIYALRNKHDLTHSPVPNLAALNDDQLVEQLLEANAWRRDTAQRLLLERLAKAGSNSQQPLARLKQIALDRRLPIQSRIQAMWTVSIMAPEDFDAGVLFADDEHEMIINVIRAMGIDSIADDQPLMKQLASHPHHRVRFELVLALGGIPPDQRSLLDQLAVEMLADPWFRAALLSSAVGCAPQLLSSVYQHAADSPARSKLADGLIATAMGENAANGFLNIVASLDLRPPSLSAWQQQALAAGLDNLRLHGLSLRSLESELTLENRDTLKVINQSIAAAIATMGNPEIPTDQRVVAMSLACHANEYQNQTIRDLAALLAPQNDHLIQKAAVDALARIGKIGQLIEIMHDSGPALQSKIQTVLLTRPEWTGSLLHGMEQGLISIDDLNPSSRELLGQYNDEVIRERYQYLLKNAKVADRSEILDHYRQALSLTPDSENGRNLFATHCAACHRLGEFGQNTGPDLAGLQNKSAEYLLTSIMDPNRAIESKYRAYKLSTDDGQFFAGLILEESATSVKLALADGTRISILRSNIENMESSNRSFMPEGFETSLNVEQMADLLGFVTSQSGNQ